MNSKPAIIPHHITCPFPIIISFTEYPVFIISKKQLVVVLVVQLRYEKIL